MKALLFAMVIQALSLRGEQYIYSDDYVDCSNITIADIAEDGYTFMPEKVSLKDYRERMFMNENNELEAQHKGYHVSSDLADEWYYRVHKIWR